MSSRGGRPEPTLVHQQPPSAQSMPPVPFMLPSVMPSPVTRQLSQHREEKPRGRSRDRLFPATAAIPSSTFSIKRDRSLGSNQRLCCPIIKRQPTLSAPAMLAPVELGRTTGLSSPLSPHPLRPLMLPSTRPILLAPARSNSASRPVSFTSSRDVLLPRQRVGLPRPTSSTVALLAPSPEQSDVQVPRRVLSPQKRPKETRTPNGLAQGQRPRSLSRIGTGWRRTVNIASKFNEVYTQGLKDMETIIQSLLNGGALWNLDQDLNDALDEIEAARADCVQAVGVIEKAEQIRWAGWVEGTNATGLQRGQKELEQVLVEMKSICELYTGQHTSFIDKAELASSLLIDGKKIHRTREQLRCRTRSLEAVCRLVPQAAQWEERKSTQSDLHEPTKPSWIHEDRSDLHAAIRRRDKDSIRSVLRLGNLDINSRDENGASLLHIACYVGDLDAVKWLLASGADPLVEDLYGQLPVHVADKRGHREVVMILCSPVILPLRIVKEPGSVACTKVDNPKTQLEVFYNC